MTKRVTKQVGIFLDDEREPSEVTWLGYHDDDIEWMVARNSEEFEHYIQEMDLSEVVISFDHDIAEVKDGEEVTGYNCVVYLCQQIQDGWCALPSQVYFHSQNPVGRTNMQKYWYNFLKFMEEERPGFSS